MSQLEITEQVPLAPKTTFKVGGPAKYFVEVKNVTELRLALELAQNNRWPIFILAGGSNLIIHDQGFDGLVIKLELGARNWELANNQLTAGAGAAMKDLVDASITAGLAGLEWAGGLPGSFGGAIRGNAGAFGGEIKDSIISVTSVDATTGQEITRDNKACLFDYRHSLFKCNDEIIIEATLQSQPGNKTELRQIADDHIRYRQDKHPMDYPNAGSIFKNVPVGQMPAKYLPLFEDSIKNDPFPIIPTAKILSVAELKGLQVGQAQLSEKHSNYIVNLGGAKAADIVALIEKIQTIIKDKYQLRLEVEPQLVGF